MLTPYQFASNSPISGVDKDGAEWEYFMKDYFNKVWGFDHTKNKDSKYVKEFVAQKSVEFSNHMKQQAKETLDGVSESPLMMGLIALTALPVVSELSTLSTSTALPAFGWPKYLTWKAFASGAGINFGAQTLVHTTLEFTMDDGNILDVFTERIDYADVAFGGVTGGSSTLGKVTFQIVFPSAFDFQGGEFSAAFFNKSQEDFYIDLFVNSGFYVGGKLMEVPKRTKAETIDLLLEFLETSNSGAYNTIGEVSTNRDFFKAMRSGWQLFKQQKLKHINLSPASTLTSEGTTNTLKENNDD